MQELDLVLRKSLKAKREGMKAPGMFFSGEQLSFVPFAFVLSEGWKSFG